MNMTTTLPRASLTPLASQAPPAAQRSAAFRRPALATAVVLVGLSAGFFFAYQASVTLGLAQVTDVTYVQSFQAINATVRNPAFAIVFFGSFIAIAVAMLLTWTTASSLSKLLMGAALVFYVAGLAITFAGHVPMNNALAQHIDVTPSVAAAARAEFEQTWNSLNLLRTLVIGASFASLTVAAVRGVNPGRATTS